MTRDLASAWIGRMRHGDFPAAWAISDAILALSDPGLRDDASLPYHLRWVWDGRPLTGRRVLVRCYHGLGDTIQFARFLPPLRAVAAHVTVEVQPQLIPLLAGVPGVDRWIPFDQAAPTPPAEVDLEIMELPHALRLRPDDGPAPYLHAQAAVLPPRTVALCWAAGDWDPARSIPESAMGALTGQPAVTLLPRPTALPVLNPEGAPVNLPETAALIAGAALVITVDTFAAHLAGALGRPTWVLLKADADWRWMIGRPDSPWYSSVRLYRQTVEGDWTSVLARVSEDLATMHNAASLRPKAAE